MHASALRIGKKFFEAYGKEFAEGRIIDVGSLDFNGSLRAVCPPHLAYTGLDVSGGAGVDVVIEDPYVLPFPDQSVDIVVTTSALEHCELFWVLYLEMLRVLQPAGLLYMNVPSNGNFHRYPVDCWRFYPDSGRALAHWAQRNSYNPVLLESFIGKQDNDVWNDFVAVFVKDASHSAQYPNRIILSNEEIANGVVDGIDGLINPMELQEDQEKLFTIYQFIEERLPRMRGNLGTDT